MVNQHLAWVCSECGEEKKNGPKAENKPQFKFGDVLQK
jgi:hypothetical protein